MVKFIIKAKDFKKFLKAVSCKGTLQFKSQGKVDNFLFSAFFIDVDKENQQLSVVTQDNYFKAIKQLAQIKAKVIEEGVIEITDKKVFDVIFDAIDVEKPIQVSSDGNAIYVENQDGDWYKRRIVGDKALDEVFEKKDKLFQWVESHVLEEDGDIKLWRFTTTQGSVLYPMRIKTTRKNFGKFVKDTLKLTKDNSTVIRCEEELITVSTGTPNSTNMSKHKLEYEDIGKELLGFAVKFSALQAIVPNLLDDVILNFRRTGADTIVMRIESFDKNMTQILSVASQDKDGVLYEMPKEDIKAEEEVNKLEREQP